MNTVIEQAIEIAKKASLVQSSEDFDKSYAAINFHTQRVKMVLLEDEGHKVEIEVCIRRTATKE